MKSTKIHRFNLLALAIAVGTLAACNNQLPPPVTAGSVPPVTASAPVDPSVYLQDSFEGTTLNQDVWAAFAQSGLMLVRDGRLELLNTGRRPNYPYVVTKNRVIPETGPFYFELTYEVLAGGANISFALDFLPAPAPGEAALTEPFMRTSELYRDLRLVFKTEKGDVILSGKGGYQVGAPHTLRVEHDGEANYRVIFDDTELGRFASQRRPQKFWIGNYPVKDAAAPTVDWPHLAIHAVTSATMTTPSSATPAPPSPSPSESPASSESPAPVATSS